MTMPDAARVLTVDASWFPGRPATGPTSFLATASTVRPVPAGPPDACDVAEVDPCVAASTHRRSISDVRVDLGGHSAREPLHLPGTLLPPFTDAHVHLGLVDATALLPHGIAAVHDLGWVPEEVAAWACGGDHATRAGGGASDAKGVEAARGQGRSSARGDGAASPGTEDAPTADPARLARVAFADADVTRLPHVAFAGAFLTAPGGYPSDRAWAPDGSVEEVATPDDAVAAVDRQLAVGAAFVKIMLNSAAGPVPDDATLAALVGRANERGAAVVAHAEGPGQAARAFEAGVDRLAHAPFSEPLPDALLLAMARPRRRPHLRTRPRPSAEHDTARGRTRHEGRNAADNDLQVVFGGTRMSGVTWVSTLDIHGWGAPTPEQDVAIDNVRRFVAAGGAVVYGTDLGNGPLPLGVNGRELRALAAAGLEADALLRALTSTTPSRRVGRRTRGPVMHADVHHSAAGASLGALTYVPGTPPDDVDELCTWLAGATTLHLADVLRPGFAPSSGTTTREDQP